jgi:flagellar basal-body rod modification protein FlgD
MISATGSDFDLSSLTSSSLNAKARKSNDLDQEAFLSLMVTQFQNQDPFKPQDPSQFLSQLAQFSSVSTMSDVSKSVAKLSDAIYANQTLQASSLIGRSVLVPGNTGTLTADQPLTGGVEMPFSSSSGSVRVYSENGALVRQIPLGPREAGLNRFSWDGLDANGQKAPPGRYRFDAAIRTTDGATAVTTYSTSKVTSISLSTDLANSKITTDTGAEVRLAQVKAIQ